MDQDQTSQHWSIKRPELSSAKPDVSFQHLKKGLQECQGKYVLFPEEKLLITLQLSDDGIILIYLSLQTKADTFANSTNSARDGSLSDLHRLPFSFDF